ncbi:hypothetical protein HDU76_000465 [Blyttiomyces sp. JEL0837]|nr:hypothetical protein HDU76_000465 [Blyttiomyces sp. JEL0837]
MDSCPDFYMVSPAREIGGRLFKTGTGHGNSLLDVPGAVFFILIQIILLIDFAYTFSEMLLEWWETTDDKKYLALLLTLTFGAFIGSITLTGFYYAWFGKQSCGLNQFFISMNLILCLIMTGASIATQVQDMNPKSGIAQAAMVVAYATYLVGSSLASEPEAENGTTVCNPTNESASTRNTTIILGTVFTFLALAYSTSRAATQGNVLNSEEGSVPLMNDHVRGAVESGALPASSLNDEGDDDGPVDDEKEGVQYSYSTFHIVFLLASCYLSQLITNWDTVSIDKTKDTAIVGKGWAAVWVKIVSSWIVLLLYGWTLIAPLVLPDREW